MITGDSLETAKSIAEGCGIVEKGSNDTVIIGEEFMKTIGGIVCKKCKTEKCPCPRFMK